MSEIVIRPERDSDREAIRRINLAAFDGPVEAGLVDRLRSAGCDFLSWVADERGDVVGHILFTPVTIGDPSETSQQASLGNPPRVAGLAPMAVRPDRQGRGIGSALVERGLAACRDAGFAAVVVLGHADYYPRFGFRPASRWELRYEVDVPDEVFLALELRRGGLAGHRGVVRYHPEFSEPGH